MDNRRIGKGATLYLTIANAGALLTMGDAHTAQGKGLRAVHSKSLTQPGGDICNHDLYDLEKLRLLVVYLLVTVLYSSHLVRFCHVVIR